jgi:hypothetical protein
MSCQKLTQKRQVLKHMREHGYITTLIATRRYDCYRLSERIRELERDGYFIHHLPIKVRGKRYMGYSLFEQKRARAA